MKRIALLLIGVALVSSACAQAVDPGAPADPGVLSVDGIDGDWVLVSGVPTVQGAAITLSFDGSQIGGRAACNTYGGIADVGDGTIAIPANGPGGTFFMTEMGCEPKIQASEQAFVDAIFAVTTWSIDGGQLHLTGPDVDLVFDPVAPIATSDLVGTEWVLQSLIDGESATSVAGDEATLLLSDDGTVAGSTGCRTLAGTWVVRSGEVFFPNFSAEGECPSDLASQDGFIVGVLGDGFRPEISGNRLEVTDASGQGLVYAGR